MDSVSGHEVLNIEDHSEFVDASFHPFKQMIASISMDGKIHLRDFPSLQVLIDSTRERYKNRQPMEEERKKFYLE